MKKEVVKKIGIPFDLQMFAEEANNDDGNENENGSESGSEDSSNDEDNKSEKTFTQSEVNRLMAKEKKEGKKSVLKSLGFNSEKEAQNAFNLLKALTDSQKSEEEKAKENEGKASKEKEDAEQRAMIAEAKLSCLTNGVNKDSIDDVLAIAMLKVSDDKELENVIKDMKKDKRYSSFFTSNSSSGDGTGNPPGHSSTAKEGDKKTNSEYGKRLAQSTIKTDNKKKSYFD